MKRSSPGDRYNNELAKSTSFKSSTENYNISENESANRDVGIS